MFLQNVYPLDHDHRQENYKLTFKNQIETRKTYKHFVVKSLFVTYNFKLKFANY